MHRLVAAPYLYSKLFYCHVFCEHSFDDSLMSCIPIMCTMYLPACTQMRRKFQGVATNEWAEGECHLIPLLFHKSFTCVVTIVWNLRIAKSLFIIYIYFYNLHSACYTATILIRKSNVRWSSGRSIPCIFRSWTPLYSNMIRWSKLKRSWALWHENGSPSCQNLCLFGCEKRQFGPAWFIWRSYVWTPYSTTYNK